MDATLLSISIICLVVLLLIMLLKKLHQPYLIAYLSAGIALRPFISGLLSGTQGIEQIGEIGLLLLMLFLGTEMNIPDKRHLLIKPVIAQLMKILFSILFVFAVGQLLGLDINKRIILCMLFAFNSTPIVSDYLQRNHRSGTAFGIIVFNMLLLQDLLLAPALTVLRFLGSGTISGARLIGAAAACIVIYRLLKAVRNKRLIQFPGETFLENDHELQLFLGLFLCLGFGVLAQAAGLTSAIGSFVAGMLIGRTTALHWLEKALGPLRSFFVPFFFMSVGLQVDLLYIIEHPGLTLAASLFILISNSALSAVVFYCLRFNSRDSLFAGAMLAHTGEFGILACSLAYKMHLVDTLFFKTAIAITGLSLLLSTTWVHILRVLTRRQRRQAGHEESMRA